MSGGRSRRWPARCRVRTRCTSRSCRGLELARWVSEYVAGLCAAAPGRIYGLGTAPLQDPGLAAGELGSLSELGLAGVEIASNVAGASLGDSRFAEFFGEASRLGLAVFV